MLLKQALERNAWMSGFKRYDLVEDKNESGLYELDENENIRRDGKKFVELDAWRIFRDSYIELRDDLIEATGISSQM